MNQKEVTNVQLRIKADTYAYIQKIAMDNGVTFTAQANILLRSAVKEHYKHNYNIDIFKRPHDEKN